MGTALTRKTRRHSGRVTPRLTIKGNRNEIINEALEPQVFWDDWKDYRDGQRGSKDRKLLRSEHMAYAKYFDVKKWNKRLKKLIFRRRARKNKNI